MGDKKRDPSQAAGRRRRLTEGTRTGGSAHTNMRAVGGGPMHARARQECAFAARGRSVDGFRGMRTSTTRRHTATMAAKVSGFINLAIDAGKASPAPPIGPALGSKGVNIMAFCKEYNARTQDKAGTIVPVEITVYEDKSFTFILKTPPASELLKKYAKVPKGAGDSSNGNVGSITRDQLKEIAEIKMPDLNANDIEAAMKIVGGTAFNMGIQ